MAIEDDADALVLVRAILEAVGATVTTMQSPADALQHVEQSRPDVLIVDLGMPGTDGFEFLKRVRQSDDPDVKAIPAAATTAYVRSEDRKKALLAGFQTHLAKPVDPGELVSLVATLTGRGR